MVLDILAAALLVAFGILIVYFAIEGGSEERTFLLLVLVGAALIVAGSWVIITKISLAVLLTKLSGLILAAIGFFLVFEFPDISEYQTKGMSTTGILIGIVLLIFGLYLLIFA